MNTVENDFWKFWKENGILFGCFKEPIDIGLENSIKIVEARHLISNNECQYFCMDLRNLKSATKEAHDYVNENGQDFVHACAVIVNSYLTKFIINVFSQLRKPKVPLQVFTNKEQAIKWLLEIKIKNEN